MKIPSASLALVAIKLLHTLVWGVFAGCIFAIPVAVILLRFDWAAGLSAAVLIECGIILLNRGQCPLTPLAARYTQSRVDNFDIYLPRWLARHNKTIFGTLFLADEVFLLWRWLA